MSVKCCSNPNCKEENPEFYVFGDREMAQCKACIREKQASRRWLEIAAECEDVVKWLNGLSKKRRASSLFRMIEKGKVDASMFAVILKKVDFYVPDFEI